METATYTEVRANQVFQVTILPDDPRLSAAATKKRQVRNIKAWKRGHGTTPRSVTKAHQHHLLTDCPVQVRA